MATALKMAATCMLVLTMMGQLMAAASASAPLVQADHERSASEKTGSCDCNFTQPWCCNDSQKTMMMLQLSKKTGSCPCYFTQPWCCNDSQKTMMIMSLQLLQKTGSCPCINPFLTPQCCFGAGRSAATN